MSETLPQGLKPRSIRLANRRSVLRLLLEREECTVGEIAQALSLSRTSVVKALTEFMEQDLVEEAGKGASTMEGGKRPELFRLNANARFSISLRINKCSAVIEQRNLRSCLQRTAMVALSCPDQYSIMLDEVSEGIRNFLDEGETDIRNLIAVIVGGDGQLDTRSGVIVMPAHHAWGEDLHICRDLQQKTNLEVPFYLGSVVQFAGYQLIRKYPGERVVLLLIAGITGGCAVDTAEMQGEGFTELVHMLVAPGQGETCPVCGQCGCFHERVSTSGCIKRYAAMCLAEHPLQEKIREGSLCMADVFAAADEGEAAARQLLDEIVQDFAVLVHNLAVTLRPHRIVLGQQYRFPGSYMTCALQRMVEAQTRTRFGQGMMLSFGGGFEDFAQGAAWYAAMRYIGEHGEA